MYLLPENKAFFNTGTLGAQPAVVYQTVAEHMRKVAADIAEWDYKGDDEADKLLYNRPSGSFESI
jgi:hypothetical protein